MDTPLASVDSLLGTVAWSAKGAAGDALQRASHDAAFVALWIEADGTIHWAKANTSASSLAMLAAALHELAAQCIREVI